MTTNDTIVRLLSKAFIFLVKKLSWANSYLFKPEASKQMNTWGLCNHAAKKVSVKQ